MRDKHLETLRQDVLSSFIDLQDKTGMSKREAYKFVGEILRVEDVSTLRLSKLSYKQCKQVKDGIRKAVKIG